MPEPTMVMNRGESLRRWWWWRGKGEESARA